MTIRPMTQADIHSLIPLYMDHYNTHEDGQWTPGTVYKRIYQVWSHCDSMCLVAEAEGKAIGFAMGHFEQYDDLIAYDLVEIVIAHDCQNQGFGSRFMEAVERQANAQGAAMIQLSAVNDALHEHFYGKLGYQTCNNLVLKSKFL